MPRDLNSARILVAKWQINTFKNPESSGVVEHLRREAQELWSEYWYSPGGSNLTKPNAPDLDDVAEEAADIFFMLIQLERTAGFNLAESVLRKLKKNSARQWKEPDEQGVVEHVSNDQHES